MTERQGREKKERKKRRKKKPSPYFFLKEEKKFVIFSPLMYNIKCSLNDDLRPQKGWKSSSFLSLSIWGLIGLNFFF